MASSNLNIPVKDNARPGYVAIGEIVYTYDKNNKKRSRIISSIKKQGHVMAYSPEHIVVNNRKYEFTTPPVSVLQKEDDHYVIKNDLLDIYAVGKNEDEVENDFNEEFDYLYQRLNTLEDTELSERFMSIKKLINYYVKNVAAW